MSGLRPTVEDHGAADAECERLVREGDPDRYFSVLFAPAASRLHLLALYAFNLETARIKDLVSQPLPGEIRLQWWRDRIEAGMADPEEGGQGSPVASALLRTIRAFDLPADAFERFLEARIFDLYEDPMPSRESFETYAGETASALIMLASMVLDRGATPGVADPAGHAGVAQAMTSALRSMNRDRTRHKVFIPGDILRAVGSDAAGWLAGGPPTRAAVEASIAYARDHLAVVEKKLATIPRSLRPAFLPALLSGAVLDRIEKADERSLEAVGSGPLRRSWLYWRAMRA